MANVQQFATWASIAAKIDTFPKLPSGGVDVFLTKAEILAKGGGLVKIEDGYSDNSFVALSDVSQYVVEWRYEFYFKPTAINLDYIGNAQTLRLVSTKQKFINNIAQGDPVKVGSRETVFDSWLIFVENSNIIRADMNGETPRSLNYTRTQDESGKTASCMVHQAAGVVSWEYELNITGGQTLNFAGNTAGSQEVRFESYKYKTVNGERTGEKQWVSVETGFSSGDNYNSINQDRIGEGILTISVQANGSLSSRSEVNYIRQAESGKEVYYTCNQDAGQEGWNYYFSGSPTSMSFGATGGSQTVNVSSYRRRTVNGNEDGHQESVNYLGSSNAWASVSGDTITVGQNDSTSQRALNVTYTQSSSGKTFSISITQAAAVIRETYTIVEDKWETTFTSSDRHHLLTVKLKYAKSLNGSIIETSFLPNSQWTCTGTMAKGDHWTVNNFNASLDDKRTAIVSLSPVPQDFASDNVEVSNSMSSSVARFLCMFSNT